MRNVEGAEAAAGSVTNYKSDAIGPGRQWGVDDKRDAAIRGILKIILGDENLHFLYFVGQYGILSRNFRGNQGNFRALVAVGLTIPGNGVAIETDGKTRGGRRCEEDLANGVKLHAGKRQRTGYSAREGKVQFFFGGSEA